jgi:hypothetical protein
LKKINFFSLEKKVKRVLMFDVPVPVPDSFVNRKIFCTGPGGGTGTMLFVAVEKHLKREKFIRTGTGTLNFLVSV